MVLSGSEKVKNRFYDIEIAFLEGLAVKYIAERGSVAVNGSLGSCRFV